MRVITFFLAGTLLLVAGVGAWWVSALGHAPAPQHGMLIQASEPAPDFTLTNTQGERVRLSEMRGRTLLLFFGYTHCPDVCPTTLANLKQAMSALGTRAEQVQVVMITVDPLRDTPEQLGRYLAAFSPDYVGLTGTEEEIQAVMTHFGIYASTPTSAHEHGHEEAYTVDHTASVLLLDPQGVVRLLLPYDTSGDAIASDVAQFIR